MAESVATSAGGAPGTCPCPLRAGALGCASACARVAAGAGPATRDLPQGSHVGRVVGAHVTVVRQIITVVGHGATAAAAGAGRIPKLR